MRSTPSTGRSLGEYVRQARLPGSAGKAPEALVIKRFAKEIAEEFKQKVVTKAYRSGLDKEKLDVLSVVSVEEGTIEPGLSAAVTVVVDVRPDFSLPDYVGLPTQIAPVDPTDAEIDSVIQALRSEGADFKPAERAAQKATMLSSLRGLRRRQEDRGDRRDKQLYAKVPRLGRRSRARTKGSSRARHAPRGVSKVTRGACASSPADFQRCPRWRARPPNTPRDPGGPRADLPELDEKFSRRTRRTASRP